MSDTLMSVLLIGISGVLLFAILGWDFVNHSSRNKFYRLKGIHNFYKAILILFVASSCSYLLLPSFRKYFGSMELLNNDYVNATGFVILTLAFILIIKAQKRLDKQLHMYYSNMPQQGNSKIVPDTENHLLGYVLLVYVGMFIVVSTFVTAALLVIALIGWYFRYTNRKYKTPTQIAE